MIVEVRTCPSTNTGVNIENVTDQLAIADGAVVGTTFKHEGNTWNTVDSGRVEALMQKVKKLRES